jgi:integrase
MITTRVKGGRIHGVPISDRVGEILDELAGDHDEFVFTYEAQFALPKRNIAKGQRVPYSYTVLSQRHRRACRKAGIEDYRFHDNRHTAASRILRACNGNMRVVQQLLGHRHLVSCHRYSHLHGGAVAVELEKLPPSR